MLLAVLASASALQVLTVQACWEQASAFHNVPADLLVAIARTESGLNARAVHRNADPTAGYDIGLMQINSRHLQRLVQYGIGEHDLYDPCVNLHVGAWLLSGLLRTHGAGWNSVGAYNASCSRLRGPACQAARSRYAWRVYRNLPGVLGTAQQHQP